MAEGRTQIVFGTGSADADLMFVGEAPGFNEDKQGEPFVGQAGKLLNELLEQIGLSRGEVYIANVLKCRPPQNRDPQPDEIDACRENLFRQVQIVRPRVLCTLGRFATHLIAETTAPMGAVRGRAKRMEVGGVPVVVFPVFHPAAALYTPANRKVLEEDFARLRVLLERGESVLKGPAAEPVGEPTGEPAVEPAAEAAGASAGEPAAEPVTALESSAPAVAAADDETEQLPLW